MLHYHTIPVTAFQQNCSLVWCDQQMEAAVIDPGGDLERIEAEIALFHSLDQMLAQPPGALKGSTPSNTRSMVTLLEVVSAARSSNSQSATSSRFSCPAM